MKTKHCKFVLIETKEVSCIGMPTYKLEYDNKNLFDPHTCKTFELVLVSNEKEDLDENDLLCFGNFLIDGSRICIPNNTVTFINPIDNKLITIEGIERFEKVVVKQDQISETDILKAINYYNDNSYKFEDVKIEMADAKYVDIKDELGNKYGEEWRKVKPFPKLTKGFVNIVGNNIENPNISNCIPEDIFLKDIKILITNFFINNPNYVNGYYSYDDAFKLIKDTKERANYILERIENIEHLVKFEEKLYTEKEVKHLCSRAALTRFDNDNLLDQFDKWFDKLKK